MEKSGRGRKPYMEIDHVQADKGERLAYGSSQRVLLRCWRYITGAETVVSGEGVSKVAQVGELQVWELSQKIAQGYLAACAENVCQCIHTEQSYRSGVALAIS